LLLGLYPDLLIKNLPLTRVDLPMGRNWRMLIPTDT
jgi:hypothetical protein